MALTLVLSFYLAIAATIKKKYIMVFLSLVSMSVAMLSIVRNSYHFVQVSGIASTAYNIALIALAAITVFALCKKE